MPLYKVIELPHPIMTEKESLFLADGDKIFFSVKYSDFLN